MYVGEEERGEDEVGEGERDVDDDFVAPPPPPPPPQPEARPRTVAVAALPATVKGLREGSRSSGRSIKRCSIIMSR